MAQERNLPLLLAGFIAFLAVADGCRDEAKDEGKAVARVGDRVVTREEFERQFTRRGVPGGADSDSMRARFLESMIQKELMVLEASERGFFAGDSAIDRAVDELGARLLRERVRGDEAKVDSTVTEDEIREAFELSAEEVEIRHILHWSEAALDSARERIDKGEVFAEVAAQVSQDARSAPKGGLLPWLTKLQLIREFRAAVDTSAQGQVVGPFRSAFGWHLAVIEDRRQRSGADQEAERDELRAGVIAERVRDRRFAFLDEYRRRYQFEIDEQAVASMAAEASRVITAAAADSTKRDHLIEQWVPSDSDLILARYENGLTTVGDYQKLLREESFFLGQRLLPGGAIGTIRELFYNEARLREARRLDYDEDPEWRRQVALKREELVVERLYREQVEGALEVTEEKARVYYDAHPEQFRKPERFRYGFMRVDDSAVAEALVPEIGGLAAQGFDSLVAVIKSSGHLIDSARDTGLLEAQRCGAVAKAARTLEPGSVGQVAEADGSHTAFVLIEVQPEAQESFEAARERVQTTITNLESEERLVNFLKELERKFAVKRYPERLQRPG